METNVFRTGYLDLAKLQISRRRDVSVATMELYAQINKWCAERNYQRSLTTHSILLNKLMYFTEKEVQKVNPRFKIDTGWYLYGPCFEEGRAYEVDQRPINILPMSDGVSDQLASVCEELVPRFQKFSKEGGRGGVLRDFLGYIYKAKCDHAELQEYYEAKHGLQCQLWGLADVMPKLSPTELAEMVSKAVTRFDRVLIDGDYAKVASLDEATVERLVEFTPLLEEHARMVAEGGGSLTLLDTIQQAADRVLKGLAHLNYAGTFDSCSARHTQNVRATHISTGRAILDSLEIENQRLYDAYGSSLKTST